MRNLSSRVSRFAPAMALFTVGLAIMLPARPARAYILPADFLSRLVADGHKNSLKDVTMNLAVEVPAGQAPQEARLYLKRPERMRFVGPAESGNVTVVREGLQANFSHNALMTKGLAQELLPLLMLPKGRDLDESSARIIQAFGTVNVDGNTVSLARHADGVAYVIGAKVWETDKPQVWIDKATYMPVRIRLALPPGSPRAVRLPQQPGAPSLPEPSRQPMRELRLLNYVAGLPRLLEEYNDDVLVRRMEVTQLIINQNLPETLFDLREGRAARP